MLLTIRYNRTSVIDAVGTKPHNWRQPNFTGEAKNFPAHEILMII